MESSSKMIKIKATMGLDFKRDIVDVDSENGEETGCEDDQIIL
jgi:hypothetical protein